MRESQLGELTVSCLGLGCMGMSQSYGVTADEAESIATVHAAIDAGCTFLDTADVYGDGANEELVGRALAGRRDEVVLATKFGFPRPSATADADGGRRQPGVRACRRWTPRCGGSASTTSTCGTCTAAIRRCRSRRPSARWPRRCRPARSGTSGCPRCNGETVRAAHAVHPISAVQSEWSLWTRDPETVVLPTLRELGIGFVPFSPLGRGFLTGQLKSPDDFEPDDMRRGLPRFSGENFQRNLDLVDAGAGAGRGARA